MPNGNRWQTLWQACASKAGLISLQIEDLCIVKIVLLVHVKNEACYIFAIGWWWLLSFSHKNINTIFSKYLWTGKTVFLCKRKQIKRTRTFQFYHKDDVLTTKHLVIRIIYKIELFGLVNLKAWFDCKGYYVH